MSNYCENKNPLFRDGTSQQQRLIKALLPDYVKVDERDMRALIEFVDKFASQIQYYNQNNQKDGSWKELVAGQMIDELNQRTEPHYALFIAFFEVFRYAQESINTITKRHLDFYYKDVLRLSEKKEVPDQVFVLFKLAKNAVRILVDEHVALEAGVDDEGNPRIYKTKSKVVVTRAQTTQFKSLFYNKQYDGRLYASPIANSENGEGKKIETPEPKWHTFGNISNPAAPFNGGTTERPQAAIGFAVASPVLFLAEGNRIIKITLTVNTVNGLSNNLLSDAFCVQFSGEETWISPSNDLSKLPGDATYLGAPGSNTIIIQRTVTEDQPAIEEYNQEALEEPLDTSWPVARVLLNTENTGNPYLYQLLRGLEILSVKIDVDVEGVKSLIIQNDNGKLDPSNPFMPFGSRPKLTSSFYIGSRELFRKQLTSIELNINWKGLPETSRGFYNYYEHYIPVSQDNSKWRANNNFRAQVDVLTGRIWKELIPWESMNARLFDQELPITSAAVSYSPVSTTGTGFYITQSVQLNLPAILANLYGTKLRSFRQISVQNNAVLSGAGNPGLEELESYTVESQSGFIRLQLENVDFGHSDYQNSYATQAINAALYGTSGYPLPNDPYTPEISELSVAYTATAELSLANVQINQTDAAYQNKPLGYYHIEPFGVREIHPFLFRSAAIARLLPLYNDEGTLYIGIERLEVPQVLSVLFKVAEGSSDPNLPVQKVKWSYLSGNEWIALDEKRIIADGTSGLLTSGVVVLDLPGDMNSNNTLLPGGYSWIKIAVENNSRAICDMIEIAAQAVEAGFSDNGNTITHYESALPADSINGFVNSIGGIAEVTQPYASFGGSPQESDMAFYVRISERLRHKNRAVMIWDYERLILEKFPKVYKVKCMNHTRFISSSDINELVPGCVSLVVVSNVKNQNAVNLLQPSTSLSTLSKIENFIKKMNPPSVDLYVKNPIYEEILVRFNVRFHQGIDAGYHIQLLNNEIKSFLAPWAYNGMDVSFGGKIEASVILYFIEKRPYVDYVACFEMDQITPNEVLTNIDVAITTSAASILTSVNAHEIYVLETDDCECDDNNVTQPERTLTGCSCEEGSSDSISSKGIGSSTIGGNFIVGDGKIISEDDFEIE